MRGIPHIVCDKHRVQITLLKKLIKAFRNNMLYKFYLVLCLPSGQQKRNKFKELNKSRGEYAGNLWKYKDPQRLHALLLSLFCFFLPVFCPRAENQKIIRISFLLGCFCPLADFVKIKNPRQQNRQDLFFGPKQGRRWRQKRMKI